MLEREFRDLEVVTVGASAVIEVDKSVDRDAVLRAMIGAHRLTAAMLEAEARGLSVAFALGNSWWLAQGGGWHASAHVGQRSYFLGRDTSSVIRTTISAVGLVQPNGRALSELALHPAKGSALEMGHCIADAFASTFGMLQVVLGFDKSPDVSGNIEFEQADHGSTTVLVIRLQATSKAGLPGR